MNSNNFFIITGGPGSGKTTLVESLQEHNLSGTIEAGRAIIKNEVVNNGNALPWLNPVAFAELMFDHEMASYQKALESVHPVIFDRGIPDVIGYLRLTNLPVPTYMTEAVKKYRYNNHVFIAPPWDDIFTNDAERKQTPAEARLTYQSLVEVYQLFDYTLVHLPLASVSERVKFILNYLI